MFRIVKYNPDKFEVWNRFVSAANNGTLFHRMDFLNYHGNKFESTEHSLMWYKGDSLFAVMPMNIYSTGTEKIAQSPYGASFGGIVIAGKIKLKESMELCKALISYLENESVTQCNITISPSAYSKEYSACLEYGLCASGFILKSRDLFNVVELKEHFIEVWNKYEGRARTTIRKYADDFNLTEDADVNEFYPILLEDKKRHNNAAIAHSLAELVLLKQKFPASIRIDIARHIKTGARAAVCYFIGSAQTIMTFYMAQEDKAVGYNGTSILVNAGVKKACEEGYKYFDFGSSTFGYLIDNIGLAQFKESFGAIGLNRDKFVWYKNEN